MGRCARPCGDSATGRGSKVTRYYAGRHISGMMFFVFLMSTGCSGSVVPVPHTAGSVLPTYFVAVNGSNTNPGTLQRPFRTIQHGLDVATTPGATVFVRGGTYHEGIAFPADGTLQRPILLLNYPNEHPVISGGGDAPQKLVRIF